MIHVTIGLTLPDKLAYDDLMVKIVELQMETNERLSPNVEIIKINEHVNIDSWVKTND